MHIVLEIFVVLGTIFCYYVETIFRLFVPKSPKSIKDEVVLVTGAGHGIGRQYALEFSKRGATVVVCDINEKLNEETADLVRKIGGTVFSCSCDVTSIEEIKLTAQKIRTKVGDVTILVNNAGILNGGELLKIRAEDIVKTFEVNTLSHFWTVREFLPSMLAKNHGHIVTVASLVAFSGTAKLVDYSSSKFAALGFHEALTEEIDFLGKTGVKTSVVCPHFVDTGLIKHIRRRFGKTLTPEEVADVAIEGILKDEPVILVPSRIWIRMKIENMMPRKAKPLIKKFGQVGIDPQYAENKKSS